MQDGVGEKAEFQRIFVVGWVEGGGVGGEGEFTLLILGVPSLREREREKVASRIGR